MIDFGDFGQPVTQADWEKAEIYCRKCGVRLYGWLEDYGKFTDPQQPIKLFDACCIGRYGGTTRIAWSKNPFLGAEAEEKHINKYFVTFRPVSSVGFRT